MRTLATKPALATLVLAIVMSSCGTDTGTHAMEIAGFPQTDSETLDYLLDVADSCPDNAIVLYTHKNGDIFVRCSQ